MGERDDPAYAEPLPPTGALDEAARLSGFKDWFAVPTAFRDATNRAVIVNARLILKHGTTPLSSECRERATYLKAMEPEGLSTIERQSMETLFKAADHIEQIAWATAKETVPVRQAGRRLRHG